MLNKLNNTNYVYIRTHFNHFKSQMFLKEQFTCYVTEAVNLFTCFLIKITYIFENYLININKLS